LATRVWATDPTNSNTNTNPNSNRTNANLTLTSPRRLSPKRFVAQMSVHRHKSNQA